MVSHITTTLGDSQTTVHNRFRFTTDRQRNYILKLNSFGLSRRISAMSLWKWVLLYSLWGIIWSMAYCWYCSYKWPNHIFPFLWGAFVICRVFSFQIKAFVGHSCPIHMFAVFIFRIPYFCIMCRELFINTTITLEKIRFPQSPFVVYLLVALAVLQKVSK